MAQELSMKSRGRLLVLMISVPVLAFAVVGGFMGRAMAQQESYQFLRIFEDVVTLIVNNYVEEVQPEKVMRGAMHGLADGLDPDSSYLDVTQVKVFERADALASGRTGIELTRQYYLRVVAARDGSPAARAGLRPGDYIRAIDGESTRDTTVY
jgi:carboxyl-terminal processing protease